MNMHMKIAHEKSLGQFIRSYPVVNFSEPNDTVDQCSCQVTVRSSPRRWTIISVSRVSGHTLVYFGLTQSESQSMETRLISDQVTVLANPLHQETYY